ncbi:MAG: hypothetical protein M1486_03845 [Gammaproteobacteria bacterium]|nr:hypothetical protein [Gammaproteobacteria bacterium]
MDIRIAKKVKEFLAEKILKNSNPSEFGKPLLHDKTGFWRFRMEKLRIICEIKNNKIIVGVADRDPK